jgi:hypothetical protein
MLMTESTHRSQVASGTGELRTPPVEEKSSLKAQTAGRRRRWARRAVPLGNVLARPTSVRRPRPLQDLLWRCCQEYHAMVRRSL